MELHVNTASYPFSVYMYGGMGEQQKSVDILAWIPLVLPNVCLRLTSFVMRDANVGTLKNWIFYRMRRTGLVVNAKKTRPFMALLLSPVFEPIDE